MLAAASSHRIKEFELKSHGLKFRRDLCQIATNGMAIRAMGAEVGFARPRVSGHDVQDFVFHPIGSCLASRKKKGGEILYLRFRQGEFRHPFVRTAVQNHRTDLGAASLVVQHQHGAHQVRTGIATRSIGAMAESAGWDIQFLSTIYGSRIRWGADAEKISHAKSASGGASRRVSCRGLRLLGR
jgi:hypothetical protein